MSALLLPNEILSMPAQAARRVVEAGDGDGALLYLALLAGGGELSAAQARLRWPRERLESAYSRLAALELVARERPAPPPEPSQAPERPPEYSREDVAAALEREGDFMGLYREMERLLGRPFSDSDLKSLYTMYDFLGLPAEVILTLTSYAVRQYRRQKGRTEGVYPRMPDVRREAFRWKRLGVDTMERAEEYLRRQEQVDRREWEILSAVGVPDRRAAVEKEREFIARWVELGLSDQLIRLAYERTVYQKGAMNWPYMNKILLSWHQAGYATPEQVRSGDKPPRRQSAPAKEQPKDFQPTQDRIRKNADWLDKFLEEQEKGR